MADVTRLDADEDPLIGEVLAKTYRLTHLIGEGGMGQVFAATHVRHPQQRFAVKLLAADGVNDPVFSARFRREIEIAKRLSHPNIVEVVESAVAPDGRPYLVMELLRGEDLEQRLAQRRDLPLLEVLEIMQQVGSAVQAAHDADIVHRDLKPANIFVLDTGSEALRVKVLDFGLSKLLGDATRITKTGGIVGTLLYLTPEQVEGRLDLDQRVDIFALGAITYECLCGKHPFPGATPEILLHQICSEEPVPLRSRRPDLPVAIEAVLARAMAKERARRYLRAMDFVDALSAALAQAVGDDDATIERESARPVAAARRLPPRPRPTELASPSTQSWTRAMLTTMTMVIARPSWTRRIALGLVLSAAVIALVWIFASPSRSPVQQPPRAEPSLALEQHVERQDARVRVPRADAAPVVLARPDASYLAVQPATLRAPWPGRRRRAKKIEPTPAVLNPARPRPAPPASQKEPRYDEL